MIAHRTIRDGVLARIAALVVPMVLAVVSTSACARSQQTWVVDRFQRPGTHFQDLPPAVAAASSGDTIQVRGTTTSSVDAYIAPIIQGKALRIIGDHQTVRPIVTGPWVIQGVPADHSLILQQLSLYGQTIPQVNSYFQVQCSNNQGAIVFDDLDIPFGRSFTSVYHGVSGTHFIDCSLVVLRNSTIDTAGGPWESIRSTMVIDSCVIRSTVSLGGFAAGAIFVDNSRLHVVNSNLIGSYAPTQLLWYAGSSPIQTCASEIVISGNSRLEGGVDWNGVRYGAFFSRCSTFPGIPPSMQGPSTCHVDPSTTVVRFYSTDTELIYDFSPQTGLSFTLSPAALQVTHYTVPSSLAVLAIGPVSTTPWTHLVGPVFVDPVGMTDYLDIAPASGPLQRTFPLPPGLPLGTHACLQAFELLPSGTLLTSNATIAGLW